MKSLPRYVLCENTAELPAPFILSTEEPHMMANVLTFKDLDRWGDFLQTKDTPYYRIPGYMMAVIYAGTLNPYGVRPGLFEIREALSEMAEFYCEQKINAKPGYYKKYRLERRLY